MLTLTRWSSNEIEIYVTILPEVKEFAEADTEG